MEIDIVQATKRLTPVGQKNCAILGPLYTRGWGPLTCDMQIVWLVDKPETVQVHFTLDLEGLRGQRDLTGWKSHIVSYMTTSE